MVSIDSERPEFPGFPELRANVTFVPLQFFTVVLPHRTTSCVRIVGYLLRRLLGWVDRNGNPTREQVELTYRELEEGAGVPRVCITEALEEAINFRLVECVQQPRPDQARQKGQTGIYRLRWSEDYTNDPVAFEGFCRQEAIALQEGDAEHGRRSAKVARKNIPNAFFDYVLPRERLSVIRVVGVMLFRSIEWSMAGERKVDVVISISELSRLTRRGRRHVHAAVQDGMRGGYIERVNEGYFDPQAGVASEAATYRIRWTQKALTPTFESRPQTSEVRPVRKGIRGAGGYGPGEPVKNRIRDRYRKGHGDQCERGNGISVKTSTKRIPTTAAELPGGDVAVVSEGIALLVEIGFDEGTARLLASSQSLEVIRNQVEWLPFRRSSKNRLGMLRRAIQQNWSQPESDPAPSEESLGRTFAQHYEIGLQGHHLGVCSEKEAGVAEALLRLLEPAPSLEMAAMWGEKFGQFVRSRSPAKPWLVWVVRMYGAKFVTQARRPSGPASGGSESHRRDAHEKAHHGAYEDYLVREVARLRERYPEEWAEFERQQELNAHRLQLSTTSREFLAVPRTQCLAFADFAQSRGLGILTFWDWDRRFNAQSFR